MKLFATAKKTAAENNFTCLHMDDKVLLNLALLDSPELADLMLFDDEWELLIDNIRRNYQPYEDEVIIFIRINDFDFAEIRAKMRRTYVFNKKNLNLRYRVCEMVAVKVSVMRHKTKAWNDVAETQSVIVGNVYANIDRQDVEI